MKFLITAIGLLIILSSGADAQTKWKAYKLPIDSGGIGSASAANENNISIIAWGAPKQLVYRTKDGGKTWTQQYMPTVPMPAPHPGNIPYMLKDIHCFDSLNAIVVGTYGMVFRTNDAGETWVRAAESIGYSYFLNYVSFADRNHGVAEVGFGRYLLTKDGGETWTLDSIPGRPFIFRMYMRDSNTIYTNTYDYTFKTRDRGKNWKKVPSAGNNVAAIGFSSPSIIWMASKVKVPENVQDQRNSVLLKSTDSGNTWQTIYNKFDTDIPFGLHQCSFADSLNGIIAGGGYKVLKTKDGGATWENHWIDTADAMYFSASNLNFLTPTFAYMTYFSILLVYNEKDTTTTSLEITQPSIQTPLGTPMVWIWNISPNPASQKVRIPASWLISMRPEEITLKIYDIEGIEVADLTQELRANAHLAERTSDVFFNTETLPSGTYLVVIKGGGFTKSETLVIQR